MSIQSQTIEKYSISAKGIRDIFSDYYCEGLELNIFSKSFMYSIGYYYSEGYSFFTSPNENYNQLNLLFGKFIDSKNEKFRFQYQTGIGMFWGTIRTEFDGNSSGPFNNVFFTKSVNTVGFPIKIGGRYIPFKFLSVGIDLLGNLNFQKSIYKPMLSLEIGKLRNSRKKK